MKPASQSPENTQAEQKQGDMSWRLGTLQLLPWIRPNAEQRGPSMLDPRQPGSQKAQRQPDSAGDLLHLGRRRAAVLRKDSTPIPGAFQEPTSQKSKPSGHMATAFCPLKQLLPWQEKVAQIFPWKRVEGRVRGGELCSEWRTEARLGHYHACPTGLGHHKLSIPASTSLSRWV